MDPQGRHVGGIYPVGSGRCCFLGHLLFEEVFLVPEALTGAHLLISWLPRAMQPDAKVNRHVAHVRWPLRANLFVKSEYERIA